MSEDYYKNRSTLFNKIHNSNDELVFCMGFKDHFRNMPYLTCFRGYISNGENIANLRPSRYGSGAEYYLLMTTSSSLSDKQLSNNIKHYIKNTHTLSNEPVIIINDVLPSKIINQQ